MIDTDGADPGHPHPGLDDTIDIEWVDRRQALAGLLRVSVRPSAGATWFLAVVHQQGAAPVVVLDWELPLVSNAFEFRAPGIWADLVCETPIEQWTVGLEAFGVAVDPDEVLTPSVFGDRTPVGLDLDVEAATAADDDDDGFVVGIGVAAKRPGDGGTGTMRSTWASDTPGKDGGGGSGAPSLLCVADARFPALQAGLSQSLLLALLSELSRAMTLADASDDDVDCSVE